MQRHLLAVGAILLSVLVFLSGNGLIGTLIPVRAHIEGFSNLAIGMIGSAYFAGFVVGCFAGPALLARVGHSRTFAVGAGLAAATTLLQSIFISETLWILARGVFGFAAVLIFLVVESWLNDRATNETRGRIFSAYMTVNYGGLIVGQMLMATGNPRGFSLFSLGGIFYALCLIPVGLTRLPQPQKVSVPTPRPLRLFRLSPVAFAGCVTVGLANGAVWTLGPVYAQDHGLTKGMLSLFMAALTLGGALVQVPFGRLSDRMDRRVIIAATCAGAAALGLLIAFFDRASQTQSLMLIGLYGIFALPLYGLSVAHANDGVARDRFVETSATLLLVNALSSVFGPTLAALVMEAAGSRSLFLWTAAIHTALTVFTLVRLRLKQAPAAEAREKFEPLAQQSSTVALELDPRGPDHGEAEAA